MPELPEIEVIKRGLQPLEGAEICRCEGADPDMFTSPLRPENVDQYLADKVLQKFERYGKHLLLQVEKDWLIFHPRMSGKVWWQNEKPEKPDKVKLELQFDRPEADKLYFTSMRRFSRFYWSEGENYLDHEKIASLGPDPLKENYTRQNFEAGFKNRRATIKALLMDQSFLAGVGNIYASEICFEAGIDPRRLADEVTEQERDQLYEIIPDLLKRSVEAGGSSLDPEGSATTYRNSSGETGNFVQQHRVYDREGEECSKCSNTIEKLKLSGRSTYFCPGCQS
ncbi:MAG: bifunctional DNA-formamidopyrimidine glycosylase/DNA-(apurinic or apyrimidinic site) lyase [bacterium]